MLTRTRGRLRQSTATGLGVTLLLVSLVGCGGTASAPPPPPPPPPPVVTVSVMPANAAVLLGQTQSFTAAVTGTSNTAVNWSVNGIAGGSASTGTISAAGLYTAPQTMPSPANVTVTATSQADGSASGSASVNIQSDIVVNISPNSASVSTGESQAFTATVTGSGNPSTAVNWSVNGVPGGNPTLGEIATTGSDSATYTAPAAPPSPATVNVTATSVADPSKSASSSVTIVCAGPNSISPAAASVVLGASQAFTATLCVAPGTAITWDVNGIVGGNASVGSVTNGGNSTTYTAPAALPSSNPVTLHATSQSSPTQSASATVTVVSNVTVSVSPSSATVLINQRATFTATVSNSSNAAVTWDVNGVVNGNATLGQVCVTGSSPCAAPSGPVTGSVDYLAPAAVPSSNPVKLTATSQADPSRQGSALITLTASIKVGVSVSPPYAFPGPSSTVQFTASVTGTSNQGVNWSVASAVPGQGCSGSVCGSVDSNGLYTAPTGAPSPNAISITATSQADTTVSASAIIALTSGVVIETILPSSVTAAIPSSFTFAVEGLHFVAGSGSSASVILINGSPRTTSCASAAHCLTTLNPSDIGVAGSLSVEVQNPGTPGALSNPVPFVVVPFVVDEDVISLSGNAPGASGKDIVVVEPTTAGATPSQVSVNFAGPVTGSGSSANCTFQGSPIPITRPSSGSIVVSICVQGNQLDPGFTYEFTGPGTGDIGVAATSLGGLFPNLIQLDLTVSSTTLPGVRTLFIITPNNDRAAASGLIEVK